MSKVTPKANICLIKSGKKLLEENRRPVGYLSVNIIHVFAFAMPNCKLSESLI